MRLFTAFLAASALVLLAGCGGDSSSPSTGPTVISMTSSDTFSPKTVTVSQGSTVQWRNDDADSHSVTSDTGALYLNSDVDFPTGLPAGAKWSWVAPHVGAPTRYYYHCKFHGTAGSGADFGTGMTGVIIVQ